MGETGSYCAQQHITEVLVDIKKNTKNFDEFLEKVNEQLKGISWAKINEDTLIVTYSKCYCPMIELGLYRTPIQCNCSVGWLKKNLEAVLEKTVNVELVQSVLRDGNQCEFKIKI
jgi:predicted hydrocarbon binding protein